MTFGRQRVNMYREKTFSRKRRHCMSSGKQQSDKMIQMLVTFQLEPQPSPQSKDDIFDEDFRLSSHSRDILRHWLTPDQVQKRRPLPKRLSRLSANGTQEKKRPEENKQEKKRVSEEKKMRVSAENDPQKKKEGEKGSIKTRRVTTESLAKKTATKMNIK